MAASRSLQVPSVIPSLPKCQQPSTQTGKRSDISSLVTEDAECRSRLTGRSLANGFTGRIVPTAESPFRLVLILWTAKATTLSRNIPAGSLRSVGTDTSISFGRPSFYGASFSSSDRAVKFVTAI
jgi:hypothetical protein